MPLRARLPIPQFILALALIAAGSAAGAQTLAELHDAARGWDATWLAAHASAEAAGARVGVARAALLPQIGVQAGAKRTWSESLAMDATSRDQFGTLNAALVATQPLYRPASRIAWSQSQRNAEAAQIQLEAAAQDLMLRVARAYFDVLAASAKLQSVRALRRAIGQQLELAQANFDLGRATITDSREAEARFNLAQAQEIAAANELRIRQITLDEVTGVPGSQPLPLAASAVLPHPQPAAIDAWLEQAQALQPAILQARAALDVARLEADKARAGHRPTVDLQVSIGQTRFSGSTLGLPLPILPQSNSRSTDKSIGVVLNWPLFSGFAVESAEREAAALQEKARADLDHARRSAELAVRSAFLGVESGLGRVHALEAAERSSQAALEANELAYEVGVRINIDVLDALSQLQQTQSDLARARYDVLLGLLQLEQAAGVLDESGLARISALFDQGGAPPPAAGPDAGAR